MNEITKNAIFQTKNQKIPPSADTHCENAVATSCNKRYCMW